MIKEFQGEYRWLSNFWPCMIPYKGRVFPNVENAFHSEKNDSTEWKDYCAQEDDPRFVKKKCHEEIELRPDWEEVKEGIMLELCRIKFSQEPLRSQLLDTEDQVLQEGNSWGDTFWGVDLETGKGENRHGKILMKIREELNV
jgi:ribA/ribD-fused uncharacterized protein